MIIENVSSAVMKHKKIRRLMVKFYLLTKIRRANSYSKLTKATQDHQTSPNLLNREFDQEVPGKVLLIDITYLYYEKGQKTYLSYVKDSATTENLAYYLSSSIEVDIVYKTLKKLKAAVGNHYHAEAMLHSDQKIHYTYPLFQNKVKKLG